MPIQPPEPPQSPGISPEVAPISTFRDRSTGLQVFGVIQIILGALTSLFIPFILLGAVMAQRTTGQRMPMTTYLLACLTYGTIAIILIVLGIGSIRARRWARALNLIFSWIALFGGVSVTILITAVLPATFAAAFRRAAAANPGSANLPASVTAVILTLIIVFFALFMIAVPLAFVLFYSRKDVAETCRLRDPVERWTDRCPLPVLAASILFAYGAIYHVFIGIAAPMIPSFGRYLTGAPGAAVCLGQAILELLLAVWFYRLRLFAWWIALVSLIVFGISSALTYRFGDLLSAYSRMGWSQDQIDLINRSPMLRGHVVLWWSLIYVIAGILYLFFIKRFFRSDSPAPPLPSLPQDPVQAA
jgi:hypothetical protein